MNFLQKPTQVALQSTSLHIVSANDDLVICEVIINIYYILTVFYFDSFIESITFYTSSSKYILPIL